MKFGKEFTTHLKETLPEWRDKFLCYKPLKKLLKHFPAADFQPHSQPTPTVDVVVIIDDDHNRTGSSSSNCWSLDRLQDWFVRILREELEKFNDFYIDKEEEFVIRFQELKDRIERVKEKTGGAFTSESEFSEEMMEIRKDFVTIHGEMVLLKNYSSLNFAESLTRLVHECEENLELLFPLEAEVIEATATTPDESKSQLNTANTSSDNPPNLRDETLDVYRSTLAAMKAIKGLRKASSTSNPLSFSSLFESLDDESIGAVTAENSACNSPAMLNNREDNHDDTHSS
ncbi:SPX domain-containing protein 4 [Citrus sinensis]|uniref:SPX domain-containing protein 4 n=1 Tax=Citrus sinensis TaxID=2711 RepID=A0ACB8K565_CITSI|nr:SPX domain-containing protein 4 [Citrus sinensis]